MQKALDRIGDVDPLLDCNEVGALLGGLSRTTIWRRVKDGTLPQPIGIGGMRRWAKSEILARIERAKNARPMAA
ncbi:helix-turn-helix transcriptional regulator [Rhizobium sp. HT1-10]|jgi:predicted DNA-binding transcriptional regulator AlpA|uniref:helix-turn-helix transcriptional regulator n=1 Tax=Rhizobium sp. HT1-10 TaxID=3111638 RepID=UPI003C211FB6